jgi:carbon-monoxide dehydrogenase catalytic subunit
MMILVNVLADTVGCTVPQLPVVGCAPEWMSEKAVSIGNYVVATGIDTFLGVTPYIDGSDQVYDLLGNGIKDWVGASFTIEHDIDKLGDLMIERIEEKRKGLGI